MARVDADDLLADLDDQQRKAVTTPSTLVAVIAAAGSGKTRVLTRRIAHRIATGSAHGRHTLALTFTRQAAGELRRRLRASGLRDFVEAGTFHAVALDLLQQRWQDSGRRALTILNDRDRLLGEAVGDVPIGTASNERTWTAARGIAPADYVGVARDAGRNVGAAPARIGEALVAYEALKRRRGVIDLDDLLPLLEQELRDDGAFARAIRWRFRHVLVDEAQDLNPVQHRVLQHIVGERRDLYLVGDPAQAIYGFNGSDPTLLIDVDRHFLGVEIIELPTNHRCTPQIVRAAMHVLAATDHSVTSVSSRVDGPAVSVTVVDDDDTEARLIADAVARLDRSLVASGAVAVLARTHRQLTAIESALGRRSVRVRRPALIAGSPLAGAVRTAALLGSPSQLRGWAHDALERPPTSMPGPVADLEQAERRVAGAVLDCLREQPMADGTALRSWIATTSPFEDSAVTSGVDLLTFHAAKGREWHTVVVSGVETGLVPHRSATTIDAKGEEARLLHVAFTRASDRLIVTRAERRRGYARAASPFIAGLDTTTPPAVAPPTEVLENVGAHSDPVAARLDALSAWRDRSAWAAALLPAQVLSDDELTALARTPPSNARDVSDLTGHGPIASSRLFASVRSVLDALSDVADQETSRSASQAKSTTTGA